MIGLMVSPRVLHLNTAANWEDHKRLSSASRKPVSSSFRKMSKHSEGLSGSGPSGQTRNSVPRLRLATAPIVPCCCEDDKDGELHKGNDCD